MTDVIALQSLAGPGQEAQDAQDGSELEKVSELSFFVCGPLPSEISSFGCI